MGGVSAYRPLTRGSAMERMTGIEPAYSAWEADVLPLNYIREKARLARPAAGLPTGAHAWRLVTGPTPRSSLFPLGA